MSEAQFKNTPFADKFKGKATGARVGSSFANALNKSKNKGARKSGYKGVVQNTPEFARICNLPSRELDLDDVMDLTSIFRKPGGTMELRPVQSASLLEANIANGLFGPQGVGWGKTLTTLLMAEAMDSERAVLIVPSQLRNQLNRDIEEVYGPHFNLPLDRIVRIMSYSDLSQAKNTGLLDELEPDLIVLDEAQNLARKGSARTKRFMRYMRENPHCRLVALSGGTTKNSILDYAHFLEMALRKNSPLPKGHEELQLWAAALDVKPPQPADPGVLKLLLHEEDDGNVRLAYRRRLVNTRGVVATVESALSTRLLVRSIKPDNVPDEVTGALEEVNRTWAFNGEEYASAVSFWRFCRQMSSGFYYRWVWPDGAPNEEDREWLEARAAWKKALREKLKTSGESMDSDLLLTNAAERWRKKIEDHSTCEGEFEGEDHSDCAYDVWEEYEKGSEGWENAALAEEDLDPDFDEDDGDFQPGHHVTRCKVDPESPGGCTGEGPEWVVTDCKIYLKHPEHCTGKKTVPPGAGTKLFQCEEYITWKKVKGLYHPTPPTEAVILSDFIARAAIKRAQHHLQEGHKVIIWYVDRVVGEMLESLSGYPRFGAGADASAVKEDVIICSIATQGTGKNLQHYSANVVVTMPTNGAELEQLGGRTHRPLQEAELIIIEYFDHTESLDKCMNDCIADAMYIEDTQGQRQKILYAEGEGIQRKKIMQRKLLKATQEQLEKGANEGTEEIA